MFIPIQPAICAAALICCVLHQSAYAQTSVPSATRADPTNAASPVPALAYVSPFDGGLSSPKDRLPKAMTWREANDNVARIGGWRVYAREAQATDAAPSPAASPPVSPAPAAAQAAAHQHPKP